MPRTIRHVDNYSETVRGCNARVALRRDNIRDDRLCAEHTEKIEANVNRTVHFGGNGVNNSTAPLSKFSNFELNITFEYFTTRITNDSDELVVSLNPVKGCYTLSGSAAIRVRLIVTRSRIVLYRMKSKPPRERASGQDWPIVSAKRAKSQLFPEFGLFLREGNNSGRRTVMQRGRPYAEGRLQPTDNYKGCCAAFRG